MNTKIKRLSALNYFGGKSRYLDWLLPLIPEHTGYLEPFCGAASLFLNKQPAEIEIISDLDNRLVNFFRVLREQPDELIPLLELTLYSRQEFADALEPAADPVEDARRYFVRALQSFGGICHGNRRKNSWRVSITESRRGVAMEVSKWLNKIENLGNVIERFKMAQIENRSAFDLIPKFDNPSWFIYIDPPYHHDSRTGTNDYLYELTEDQHIKLAMIIRKSTSKIMISHYDDIFYDELYTGWYKEYGPERKSNMGKGKGTNKREVVYLNYKPKKACDTKTNGTISTKCLQLTEKEPAMHS